MLIDRRKSEAEAPDSGLNSAPGFRARKSARIPARKGIPSFGWETWAYFLGRNPGRKYGPEWGANWQAAAAWQWWNFLRGQVEGKHGQARDLRNELKQSAQKPVRESDQGADRKLAQRSITGARNSPVTVRSGQKSARLAGSFCGPRLGCEYGRLHTPYNSHSAHGRPRRSLGPCPPASLHAPCRPASRPLPLSPGSLPLNAFGRFPPEPMPPAPIPLQASTAVWTVGTRAGLKL